MLSVNQSTQKHLTTIFNESRPVEQEPGKVRGIVNVPTSMTNPSNSEQTYSLSEYFSKEICIASFQWGSEAPGTDLYAVDMPTALLRKAITPQYNLARNLTYYRANLRIRVQVNGTGFHAGMLMTYMQPLGSFVYLTNSNPVAMYTGYPNVKSRANSNNVAVLEIPYQHLRDFLNFKNNQPDSLLGKLVVTVLNTLSPSDTASSSLPVSIWLSAVQPELHNIIPDHELPQFVPTMGLETALSSLPEIANTAAPIAASLVQGDIPNLIGGVTDALGRFTGGRDYPVPPTIDTSRVPLSNPSTCQGSGIRQSQVLDLNPMVEYLPDVSHTASFTDEMDLKLITSVPMLIDQVLWKTDDQAGKILAAYPVRPNFCYSYTADSDVSETYVRTYLAHASMAFARWRGSISYPLQIIKNNFANGRLAVIFFPYEVTSDTVLTTTQLSIPSLAVIDIEEFQDYNFTVPWTSNTRWKFVQSDNTKTRLDSIRKPVSRDMDHIMGTFVIAVVNQLNQSVSSPDNCTINVYIKGGDDFEFDVPRNPFQFDLPLTPVSPPESAPVSDFEHIQLEPTMGEDIEYSQTRSQLAESSNVNVLQAGASQTINDESIIQKDNPCMHLKSLLARSYPHTQVLFTAPTSTTTMIANIPVAVFLNSNTYFSDLIHHFSEIFAFWSGSLGYISVMNWSKNVAGISTATHLADQFQAGITFTSTVNNQFDPSELDYASQIAIPAYQPHFSVTVPYKSIFTNLACGLNATGLVSRQNGTLRLRYVLNSTSGDDVRLLVLRHIGEDFRFSYLVPPFIYIVRN